MLNTVYTLHYESDGVFLDMGEQKERGVVIDGQEILYYLERKRITNLSVSAVQALIDAGIGRDKIAPQQQEYKYGEDIAVVVSEDESTASASLLQPEPGGAALTIEEAKAAIAKAGVVHGVNDEALKMLLDYKAYGKQYVVARATPPADGVNGSLIFHFSTDERTGSPVKIDEVRVDLYSLDLYVPVSEGDLLVTKVSATEGTPGTSVTGKPIAQQPGKDVVMPRGKNIRLSEDGKEMSSACSGMVEYVRNSVNVSNVYTITGDVDISTGNIDFEGCVNISGSVRSGNIVKATGGIIVGGSVEGATLIAGGNVEIKGGVHGADRGLIEAGGAVSAMFIERAKIAADGPVSVDVSIHSIIETSSYIHALGQRGAIIGGFARAGGDVVANFIGALSHKRTEVEAGCLPRRRARLGALEKELEKLKGDKTKLAQLDAYLDRNKATMEQATWHKLHISGIENKKTNELDTAAAIAEMEEIRREMERATENKVHVFETAFGESRITIGPSTYKVIEDIGFATFIYSDGEVVFRPCEKSKTDYKTK